MKKELTMAKLNIFKNAEDAAKLLKLKTANDSISQSDVRKISKLKQYVLDKYDTISRENLPLTQELIKNISDVETSVYKYETLKKYQSATHCFTRSFCL